MPRVFDWKADLLIIEQFESFFQRFYRIPEFIKVGNIEIPFPQVKAVIERYLHGQDFMYWKRSKLVPQIVLAKETLKLRMVGG